MTNHEKHILLWDELARTGVWTGEKPVVFDRLFPNCDANSDAACNACWACEECGGNCELCPIDWVEEGDCCDLPSPYKRWKQQSDPDQRKLLAAQIRDLPWREK